MYSAVGDQDDRDFQPAGYLVDKVLDHFRAGVRVDPNVDVITGKIPGQERAAGERLLIVFFLLQAPDIEVPRYSAYAKRTSWNMGQRAVRRNVRLRRVETLVKESIVDGDFRIR